MAIKVFTPSQERPRIQNQPLEVYRVESWEKGLDVSPPSVGRLTFSDLVGMSIFRTHVAGRAEIHTLLLVRDRPRPLYVDDPGKIQFQTFAALADLGSGMDKFRQWAILVARSSEYIVVDQDTADFLKQGHVADLERRTAELVAAFVKILGDRFSLVPGASSPPSSSSSAQSGGNSAP